MPQNLKSGHYINLMPERVQDADAERASCELDAAADQRWFDANPDKLFRARPCTPLEIRAGGYEEGATAHIYRLPDEQQLRIVIPAGAL